MYRENLKDIPYKVEIRSLSKPYYREIGVAMKDKTRLPVAVVKFLEYLKYRE